jgi:ceramide glucosyltransferase
MVRIILILLVVASWVYWIIAFWFVRRFFTKHQSVNSEFQPPVSILKPVKGVDNQAYQNFSSFCLQDYPEYEILFGVSEPDDPVIPVIRKLQSDFPHIAISLEIVDAKWVNQKASILHSLASRARNKLLVVSDSDMKVTPDYLKKVVSPMADRKVGLVTCPYRGVNPVTFTARLEALYMGATFLPSMMVARKFLDMRFAMGATAVLRKTDLQSMGGFASVAEYLADDYQLGLQMTNLGLRVHLSDYIVSSVLGPTTFKEQWYREVRWSQCNRVSRPAEYPGIILTFSTPLSTFFLLYSDFSFLGWQLLVVSLLLRWIIAWRIFAHTQNQPIRKWLIWLPLRDMLSALVWCVGAVGRIVEWRGSYYSLTRDGRLILRKPDRRSIIGRFVSRLILLVDDIYQGFYYNFELNDNGENLLRLAISTSEYSMILQDGTRIDRGETIGEIRLWPGHLPTIPLSGPDIQWAVKFQHYLFRSLGELAEYIQQEPDLRNVRVYHGEISIASLQELSQLKLYIEKMGFELIENNETDISDSYFVDIFRNIYTFCLIWASNPSGIKNGFSLRDLRRQQIWISRDTLIKNYDSRLMNSQKLIESVGSKKLSAG